MNPTPEQVARAVIAAVKECGILEWFAVNPDRLRGNPKGAKGEMWDNMRHARAYAAFALRKAFPRCETGMIGRCVGASKPEIFLGVLISYRAKGQLPWYDPEALARIVEAIGRVEDAPPQKIIDETIPEFLPPRPRPRPRTKPNPDRPTSKIRLEDMLRQAVLNTGGRLAEE